MPTVTREGVSLHYATEGNGETVAFVPDAGYGAWQWGWQHGRVAGPREALVWDFPGSGRSSSPSGSISVDSLAADFEAVLADAGARRAHVVGAGLGGMVALRHARTYDRTRTLALFGTAPSGEAIEEDALRELHPGRADDARLRASLAGAVSPDFRDARPDLVDQICAWRAEEDATGDALATQLRAMLSFEAGPLYELTTPALVFHGLEDPVVSPRAGRRLAEDLPRGSYEPVEGGHLCFVEHARAVTDRLIAHLEEHGPD